MGEVATTHALSQYGLVITIMGIALALLGWQAFKVVMIPLGLLFFMVPFPQFIYNNISGKLQLISSQLGVDVIRLFGISVYLEGNVIDLGNYKLQVVEACSGLRYLFPLASLSFVAAYIYNGAIWKKAIIFLSSIPITILMNSFRIGVIGVLVEYGGIEQAEGFLHDFEGWIIFMACMAILILEMAILAKIGSNKMSLADAFAIDIPNDFPAEIERRRRGVSPFLWSVAVLLVGIVASSFYVRDKENIIPERHVFAEFPVEFGQWKGKSDRLEQIYLKSLKLDDYLLTSYVNEAGLQVGFYIAYYSSQQAGQAAHSPRACIPGGGWLIKDHAVKELESVIYNGKPLAVNRLLIKKSDHTQLVYYWFQQRGRDITNEWLVKWFLFWDSLTRKRTDGALVRLTVFIGPGQDVGKAELSLNNFAKDFMPLLPQYIPD